MRHGQRVPLREAVFLDRDGTVSRYVEYCRRPEDLHVLPGAGEAIRRLNRAGLAVVVVTNQSAIGRGWLTQETLDAIHQKMQQQLRRHRAVLDAIYVCPHHPEDGCACRKPRTAMFQQAAAELGLSLTGSYAIGDRLLDVQSGQAAECTTILVRSGHAPEPANGVVPDYKAASLAEAVDWILARRRVRGKKDHSAAPARPQRCEGAR